MYLLFQTYLFCACVFVAVLFSYIFRGSGGGWVGWGFVWFDLEVCVAPRLDRGGQTEIESGRE